MKSHPQLLGILGLALFCVYGCEDRDADVISQINERIEKIEVLDQRISENVSSIEELNRSLEAAETALAKEKASVEKSRAKLAEDLAELEKLRAQNSEAKALVDEQHAAMKADLEQVGELLEEYGVLLQSAPYAPSVEKIKEAFDQKDREIEELKGEIDALKAGK